MSANSNPGKYTPTGWRITGRSATAVAERAASYADRIEPGPAVNTLYAVQFTLPPALNGRPTVESLLDHLTEQLRETWPECPRLSRDQDLNRPSSRFSGVRYDFMTEPGREWLGELIWRAVHPMVAGAPITTRVLIEERKSYTRVNIRITADDGIASVRGLVGAGQAQPPFLRGMRRDDLVPIWMGARLEPMTLPVGGIADLVHNILPDPERVTPIVVLAPHEDGTYVVKPDDLAWELLGRAQLYVIREHRQTFELSDFVGRQMSSYWGAARAYMPDWSRHDDPYDHPLLIGDRLSDPVMRAVWLGEIGDCTAPVLELPPSIDERRAAIAAHAATPPPSTAKPRAAAAEPSVPDTSTADTLATPSSFDAAPLIESIRADIRQLAEIVKRVAGDVGVVGRLADEVERLRTISAVRSSSTSAIERRLARLEDILADAFPDGRTAAAAPVDERAPAEPEQDEEERISLVSIVQDVQASTEDALVFLDSASTSAADSPYEDPERVRAILEAMALVARRRRDGQLGTSLREAFNELGIDYRGAIARNTSAKMREQYIFMHGTEPIEAEEHIVLGNTFDPRRCLRVYFSSRSASDPRFIIAHVGRHFDVKRTT